MNTGYLIYQAERTRTAAEQRAVDATHGELAAALTRLWHLLTAPLRLLTAPPRSRHEGEREARQGTQHEIPQVTEEQPPSCVAAMSRSGR